MTRAKTGEPYRVIAEIYNGDRTVSDVRCDITLPKRSCGHIQVLCWFDSQQREQLQLAWEISLRADLYYAGGKKKRGDIFISRGRIEGAHGRERANVGYEYEARIFPYELTVTEYLDKKSVGNQTSGGELWITSSSLLAPSYFIKMCSTEGLRFESMEEPLFRLENGVDLQFSNSQFFLENEDRSTTVQLELVARFKAAGDVTEAPGLLPLLEDVLLLGSLAERKQIRCAGWLSWDQSCLQRYYRRSIAIDENTTTTDRDDPLIKKYDIWEFLERVYRTCLQLPHRELLRLAILSITSKSDAPLEVQYTGMFSALDSVLLYHERNGWLDAEFFRPRYATAQQRSGWQVDDLWPVADKSEGPSLYCIRNHIAHGEPIEPKNIKSLAVAKIHLQWTIERALLAILGWPVERSTVDSRSLSGWTPYKDWRAVREQMSISK